MSRQTIKFNVQDSPEFFKELRKRVNFYFTENNITKYADWNMKLKTGFMLGLYFVPFILMLTGIIASPWAVWGMWVLMGFGMSGIGLSVMHDANHGAYSQNKWVNEALGFLLNFLGGYHINWKIQHNLLHHSFTNVEGYDEDIQNNLMRFSPSRPQHKAYRFQAIYAPFLYSLMTLYWFIGKDFLGLLRYNRLNLLKTQGLNLSKGITQATIHKIWYAALTIALPIVVVDVAWWQIVVGFLTMQFICGLTLALIFQPAHVIEETEFFLPKEDGKLENNWAIHQMHTTANFANGSRFFSWFIGGLNYQIEHHLFPNVCHVHYRKISKIVKQTAQEYNLPYHQHKTFWGALRSHFSLLHQFGTGTYDKKMAKVYAE